MTISSAACADSEARPSITDSSGRRIDYARISVTDRCNYRCSYCMPEEGVPSLGHDDVMRYEEILFLCGVLSFLGVRKIRFTGGEPLVRKGLIPFLLDFRDNFPDTALSITTNASLLRQYAADIARLNLAGMNVSLDTLDAEKFKKITRVGDIRDALDGIASAKAAGIRNIKTNTVLIRGTNDGELPEILDFAWSNGLTPRLIEFMPVGSDVWRAEDFISAGEILDNLGKLYGGFRPLEEGRRGAPPLGPAKYYADPRGRIVGIIEAVSNHFCSTCNRLRITASGGMKACLFGRTDTPLIGMLRRRDEEGLKRAILEGINVKPDQWRRECDGMRRMSDIGG
jgi:cyclic pyranopterin phosphate synthase